MLTGPDSSPESCLVRSAPAGSLAATSVRAGAAAEAGGGRAAPAGSLAATAGRAGAAAEAGGDRADLFPHWRVLLIGLLAAATGCMAGILASSPGRSAVAPIRPNIAPHSGSGWAQVPALAQLAISRALGADDHAYWALPTTSGATAHDP